MPNNYVAKQCITEFSKAFKKHSGKVYKKNDPEIYAVLLSTGNGPKVLQLSEKTLQNSAKLSKIKKPSYYCPASSLHLLVGKIVAHRVQAKN